MILCCGVIGQLYVRYLLKCVLLNAIYTDNVTRIKFIPSSCHVMFRFICTQGIAFVAYKFAIIGLPSAVDAF